MGQGKIISNFPIYHNRSAHPPNKSKLVQEYSLNSSSSLPCPVNEQKRQQESYPDFSAPYPDSSVSCHKSHSGKNEELNLVTAIRKNRTDSYFTHFYPQQHHKKKWGFIASSSSFQIIAYEK